MTEFRKLFYALGVAALLAGVSSTASADVVSVSSADVVVRTEPSFMVSAGQAVQQVISTQLGHDRAGGMKKFAQVADGLVVSEVNKTSAIESLSQTGHGVALQFGAGAFPTAAARPFTTATIHPITAPGKTPVALIPVLTRFQYYDVITRIKDASHAGRYIQASYGMSAAPRTLIFRW